MCNKSVNTLTTPTARAAELLIAMRASTSSADDSEEWDVTNHVAPMCDRLVAVHGWSPLEVCAVLEEIMVWWWQVELV